MHPMTGMKLGATRNYYYEGGVKLIAAGTEKIKVPYARITSAGGGQWGGTIQVAGALPPELKEMMGGTVMVYTEDNAWGKATATGDYTDGAWTVTLKGV